METSVTSIETILQSYTKDREHLIPILQHLQHEKGYIDADDIATISQKLNLSENEIYGVATFYTQFKFTKPGKHCIKVCMGTACHVRESDALLNVVAATMGIQPGDTREDGLFSLDRVACLGCCALSPVVVIDDEIHARMTQPKLSALLQKLKEQEGIHD
jgi:NADH-quinone oxidoreductase subunit E